MAYDEKLAGRVRSVLKGRRGVSEKKMFGGLSFLVRGNMACGVVDDPHFTIEWNGASLRSGNAWRSPR